MPRVLGWIFINHISSSIKFYLWNASEMSFWLQIKMLVGGRVFWGWMEIELPEGNEEWHFVKGQTGKTREEHYLGRGGDAWGSG